MEILLWLAPAAVATLVAMVAVGWFGREGRTEVDREEAARRLGRALERSAQRRPGYAAPRPPAEHASGVAIRPSRARPVVLPGEQPDAVEPAAVEERSAPRDDERSDRRAS